MKATHQLGAYLWQRVSEGHVIPFNGGLIHTEQFNPAIVYLHFNQGKPSRIESHCNTNVHALTEIFHRHYYESKTNNKLDL